MGQKKSTGISQLFPILILALVGASIGIVSNQITSVRDFPQRNEYVIYYVLSAIIMMAGITAAQQEEKSSRRNFFLLVTFIGLGGALNYGGRLIKEGWLSNGGEIAPSPPTTPTQTANEVIPSSEITPKPKPSPNRDKEATDLVKGTFSFKTVEVNERGESTKEESKTTSMWIENLGDGIQIEMVYIPAGKYTMGSPIYEKGHNERKQIPEAQKRDVSVQSILMSRHTVTQSQWKSISKLARIQIDLGSDPSYFKGDLRPVERVTWDETQEFCARLSNATGREYRLPTEAEWEYACRATTTTPFYFGNTITTNLANYDGSSESYNREPKGQYRKETTAVGIFPPNAYGLFDMHGNVWEWCSDNWITDGKAFNIIRGGSWFTSARRCRSANRTSLRPDNRGDSSPGDSNPKDSVGFRIICVPKMNIFQ